MDDRDTTAPENEPGADATEDTDDATEGTGDKSETPESADEPDRGKLGRLLRAPMRAVDVATASVVAVKDSFVDFLTANDNGAKRVAEAAERASTHIGEDLDRGELTPDERMERHAAEERIVNAVSDNEKRVRKSNERAMAIAAAVVVGIAGAAATAGAVRNSKS
jgi:hypothetical protein